MSPPYCCFLTIMEKVHVCINCPVYGFAYEIFPQWHIYPNHGINVIAVGGIYVEFSWIMSILDFHVDINVVTMCLFHACKWCLYQRDFHSYKCCYLCAEDWWHVIWCKTFIYVLRSFAEDWWHVILCQTFIYLLRPCVQDMWILLLEIKKHV